MTNQQHPINPPDELIRWWKQQWLNGAARNIDLATYIAIQAYQAGADMEFEASYEWLLKHELGPSSLTRLRNARRPKPKTPREEALKVLENLIETSRIDDTHYQALRHALEALPND